MHQASRLKPSEFGALNRNKNPGSRTMVTKSNNRASLNGSSNKPKMNVPKRANNAVVSTKQLETIKSLLNRNTTNDTSNDSREMMSLKRNDLSLQDENIIQTVMRQVVELNQNKLPHDSLVKVLANVYLDARDKLGKKSAQSISNTLSNPTENHRAPNVLPVSQPLITENSAESKSSGITSQGAPISISEKKRQKWEREKAELAALAAQARPYSLIGSVVNSEANTSSMKEPNASDTNIPDRTAQIPQSFPSMKPTPLALTPMAFAANEEAELLRREEQRRQWKNELDEQVREQQRLREKQLMEEREKHESLLAQLIATNAQDRSSLPVSQPQISQNLPTTVPLLISHPSASHFSASVPVPDPMCSDFSAPDKGSSSRFNRTRGFTQSLYTNPADEVARLKRAEEIQRANLEQIEERRRLRELEKANKLLEDRLEEERLERERARLQAIAEAENRAKELKQMDENARTNFLIDNLKQAREEAAALKTQNRFRHRVDQRVEQVDKTRTPESITSVSNRHMGDTYTVKLNAPLVTPTLKFTEDSACQTDATNCNVTTGPSSGDHVVVKNQSKPQVGTSFDNRTTDSRRKASFQRDSDTEQTKSKSRIVTGSHDARSIATNPREKPARKTGESAPGNPTNATADRPLQPTLRSDRTIVKSPTTGFNRSGTRIPVPVSSLATKPAASSSTKPPTHAYADEPRTPRYPLEVVRTQDILDPRKANEVLPISRENSDKVKVREPQRPNQKAEDQHLILDQLSEIRKSLQLRQMLYESGTFDDDWYGDEETNY